jgi:hypothetical protein
MNRHYHIVKNEDLLSIVWDWITNESNPNKKKARSFHSNEKKILFVPSPSADAYQYKELLHYNWSKATTPKFATNIACPYTNWIFLLISENDIWNHQHSHHQKTFSEISVEVWWVWSHFIQWQALDLLMVRYVKLWFFWYSWMLHWPINQNKIIRQKVTKKMDLDSLQCKTHPQ